MPKIAQTTNCCGSQIRTLVQSFDYFWRSGFRGAQFEMSPPSTHKKQKQQKPGGGRAIEHIRWLVQVLRGAKAVGREQALSVKEIRRLGVSTERVNLGVVNAFDRAWLHGDTCVPGAKSVWALHRDKTHKHYWVTKITGEPPVPPLSLDTTTKVAEHRRVLALKLAEAGATSWKTAWNVLDIRSRIRCPTRNRPLINFTALNQDTPWKHDTDNFFAGYVDVDGTWRLHHENRNRYWVTPIVDLTTTTQKENDPYCLLEDEEYDGCTSVPPSDDEEQPTKKEKEATTTTTKKWGHAETAKEATTTTTTKERTFIRDAFSSIFAENVSHVWDAEEDSIVVVEENGNEFQTTRALLRSGVFPERIIVTNVDDKTAAVARPDNVFLTDKSTLEVLRLLNERAHLCLLMLKYGGSGGTLLRNAWPDILMPHLGHNVRVAALASPFCSESLPEFLSAVKPVLARRAHLWFSAFAPPDVKNEVQRCVDSYLAPTHSRIVDFLVEANGQHIINADFVVEKKETFD